MPQAKVRCALRDVDDEPQTRRRRSRVGTAHDVVEAYRGEPLIEDPLPRLAGDIGLTQSGRRVEQVAWRRRLRARRQSEQSYGDDPGGSCAARVLHTAVSSMEDVK